MPQATVSATLCCLKTEDVLENIVGGLYTSIEKQGKTWGTAAAVARSSTGSFLEVIDMRKAKPDSTNTDINVDVKYRVPDCDALGANDYSFTCTDVDGVREAYQYDRATIEDNVSERFAVHENQFNDTCEFPGKELAIKLNNAVRKMYTAYNNKLLTKIAAGVGSGFDNAALTSVTPLELKLFRDLADGSLVPQPMGMYDLIHEYERQYPDGGLAPILISGSKKVGAYEFSGGIFSGNVDGKDANKGGGALAGVYTDWDMPATLAGGAATEPLISILPGTVELLEWFEFENTEKRIDPETKRMTWAPVKATNELTRVKIDLGTAILGVPFIVDMQIWYRSCENKVIYTLRKDFDLWQIPQGAFCSANTWNYSLLWDVVCAPYACADTV